MIFKQLAWARSAAALRPAQGTPFGKPGALPSLWMHRYSSRWGAGQRDVLGSPSDKGLGVRLLGLARQGALGKGILFQTAQ